jgi:hypothetical protein
MSKLRTLIACASTFSLIFAISCAGDAPVTRDSGGGVKYDTGWTPPKDTGSPWKYDTTTPPDTGTPQADQYVWPDTGGSVDSWSWPTDTYTGAPFGCQIDADCFGKLCCPTPWGVKVCADVCSPTP